MAIGVEVHGGQALKKQATIVYHMAATKEALPQP
jgi:hypothetical protein